LKDDPKRADGDEPSSPLESAKELKGY